MGWILTLPPPDTHILGVAGEERSPILDASAPTGKPVGLPTPLGFSLPVDTRYDWPPRPMTCFGHWIRTGSDVHLLEAETLRAWEGDARILCHC